MNHLFPNHFHLKAVLPWLPDLNENARILLMKTTTASADEIHQSLSNKRDHVLEGRVASPGPVHLKAHGVSTNMQLQG